MGITTDNASNKDVFIQELLDKNYLLSPESHIRCFAHVLNLVAQEITSEIRTSIDNLREIIKIIRTSPRILEQFKKICEETNIKYVKPILDVVTRWNSTFEMLSTALQLKMPLQRIIQKLFDENRIETDISAGDWVDIEAISNFLIPLNEATEETCGDKFSCISLVISWYNEILDHIQSTKVKNNNISASIH